MVYLDNAATTRQKFFAKDFSDETTFLNSNAAYAYKTRRTLARQREIIKKCLGLKGGGVIFTRCATESAELFGRLWSTGIVCSPKEHDSVYRLQRPHCDSEIWIQQTVNQLTGEIFDIPTDRPVALDMTAGIGKIKVSIPSNCKALWFSGHKFHAPHIGVLWLCDELMKKRNATLSEKNQFDLVHGTIDVAGIFALTVALRNVCVSRKLIRNKAIWHGLVECLISELESNGIRYKIITNPQNARTLAINAIQLEGINADSLQQYLASKQIYVGLGHSSCSGNSDNRVLNAYGLSDKESSEVIRVSFDENSDENDITKLAEEISNFIRIFI
jgi:cysteine sulfinate desulfinase/cysteine desulfurase-like protein